MACVLSAKQWYRQRVGSVDYVCACGPSAGRVQISLAAEAVIWKRGILVMPPIVNKLVKAMQVGVLPCLPIFL